MFFKFLPICTVALVGAATVLVAPLAFAQTVGARIDQPIQTFPAFRVVPGTTKATAIQLSDYSAAKKSIVLVFAANRCGVTWLYADKIAALQKRYTPGGKVTVIGVHSNFEETDRELTDSLKERGMSLTVIDDKPRQELADYFGATVTPYFVVIDEKGVLRFKGPFDKMGSSVPENKRVQYLRPALDAVLAAKPVPLKTVRALGCEIARRSTKP